jgi:hypothetical protein
MNFTEAEMQARDDEDLRNMQWFAVTLILSFVLLVSSVGVAGYYAYVWWL